MIPELNFGVYAFGNLDHAELRHALMYKAIDLFLDLGDTDWNKEFLELYGEIDKQNQELQKEIQSGQIKGTSPSLELADYTGAYNDKLLGQVIVTLDGNRLKAQFTKSFSAELSHWHYDTFIGNWSTAYSNPDLFCFNLNKDGKIESLVFNNFSYSKVK